MEIIFEVNMCIILQGFVKYYNSGLIWSFSSLARFYYSGPFHGQIGPSAVDTPVEELERGRGLGWGMKQEHFRSSNHCVHL